MTERPRGRGADGLPQPVRAVVGDGAAAERPAPARATCPRTPTAATARRGRASAARTCRRRSPGPTTRFPTPSCTRTRRSRSSTAPPRPKSSPKRPSGWACTPSRSPITTGSTASCASPRPPRSLQVKTVFGAELSLELPKPQNGEPDPAGAHLLVLARGEEGYHRLAAAITHAQLQGAEKGRPRLRPRRARRAGGGALGGADRLPQGRRAARARRRRGRMPRHPSSIASCALFGRDAVHVELIDHGSPLDTRDNDLLAGARRRAGAAGARQQQRALRRAAAPAARRGGRGRARQPRARRARRMAARPCRRAPALGRRDAERFARYPGAVARTVTLADELAFPLRRAKPALPKQKVPDGAHADVVAAAPRVGGGAAQVPRPDRRRPRPHREGARRHRAEGLPRLLPDRATASCRRRGGAASCARVAARRPTAPSATCSTSPPSTRSPTSCRSSGSSRRLRDEEPDIDVDFDSDRREEIIQWVYGQYGRERAAQVANVIQYRPKNAVRDMAKALGHSPGQQDAWSKQVEQWGATLSTGPEHDIPDQVIEYASELLKAPRHLGIHSGGMVLTDRPVGEVVPIEHARMENRTVIQWDKDDAAWMGLVKFDLLGLGMLAALQYCFDLDPRGDGGGVGARDDPEGGEGGLRHAVPGGLDRGVPGRVARADGAAAAPAAAAVLRPRDRDRPHPPRTRSRAARCIRSCGASSATRRSPTPHPKLEPVLERTLGIPVFQEQLMQMAMAVGECTGEDADLLRRAMGSKRGIERIESLREKLYEGMATNGLVGRGGGRHLRADPGVRELRLRRVALAVVRAARLRELVDQAALSRRLPRGAAARAADGLLLARDPHRRRPPARRRGAPARPAALGRRGGARAGRRGPQRHTGARSRDPSSDGASRQVLDRDDRRRRCADRPGLLHPPHPAPGRRTSTCTRPTSPRPTAATGGFAVRLGLAAVKGIGATVAERIVAERERAGRLPRPPRPRAPRRGHAGAARGARDRGGVRVPRAHPPRGDLARRLGRAGPRRVPARFAASRCSRRCSPIRRATSGSRATCGRPASPPTTTR